MPFDQELAERVRAALGDVPTPSEISEKRMFGGLTFLLHGHMTCGIVGDELMLRLGEAGAEAALEEPHVRPMDFTGRPMATMVFVEPAGTRTEASLRAWVRRAVDYVRTLPPKSR
jgi:TfoX/Sxy family transcriptional regulator of competence genes